MKIGLHLLAVCAVVATTALPGHAHAADPVRGKALFWNSNGAPLSCGSAGCHAGFPTVIAKNIDKGANPAVTLDAIAKDKGGMKFLSAYVNAVDVGDIAAYIANPAAGSGTAAITLSAASLAFAAQTVGTASAPQSVTVSNTGTATLVLSSLTVAGAAAADFARGGSCAPGTSLAAGASCSVQVTFTPTVPGTRSATLTIGHNAAGGSSIITLSGTGLAPPAAASVTPTMLSFTQTVNTTSAPQAVTIANVGGQALTVASISVSGANAAEFSIGAASTCAAGTVLNAGANCSVQLSFSPAATGARAASLAVAHSASASPSSVSLSGTGTAVAQPAISLSSSALNFGSQAVGASSAAQVLTLTNSGQAPLTLGSMTVGGAAAADFTRGGSCAQGAVVAAAATCSISMSFAPAAVGTRSGSLTIASNASNGNGVVSLTGSGVQYAMSVSPTSASMQATVGTTSAPVQVTVSNMGGSPLAVSSIAITGPFLSQLGSNACGSGAVMLSPGQACNVYVAFQPAAGGPASGEVIVTSAAPGSPMRVALSAQGQMPQSDVVAMGSASNAGLGGCSVGPPDQLIDPLLASMLLVATFALLRRRARRSQR